MESRMNTLGDAARTAAISGTAAGLLSAATMAAMGKLERNNAIGPLNGPSQWLWGEEGAREDRFTARNTLVGVLIHQSTSVFWGAIHERTFGRNASHRSIPMQLLGGLATAGMAYFVDYKLTPKRLQPGFEKHLDGRGMLATYVAFGVGLALTSVICTIADRPRQDHDALGEVSP
jgi:hypothetical protein